MACNTGTPAQGEVEKHEGNRRPAVGIGTAELDGVVVVDVDGRDARRAFVGGGAGAVDDLVGRADGGSVGRKLV